jgi:tetratricopeptide (TPR) repeat protein
VRIESFTTIVESIYNSEDSEKRIIISLKDSIPSLHNLHSTFKVEMKDVKQIKGLLAQATDTTSHQIIRAESFYMLGRLHHLLNDIKSAVRYYEQSVQLNSGMSLAHFALGQIHLSKQDFVKSLEYFEKLRDKYPEDRDCNAYIVLVKSIYRQEVVPFEKLREIIHGFRYETDVWFIQGQLRLKLASDHSVALKCFEAGLSCAKQHNLPVSPLTLSNVGVLYLISGNVTSALEFTRRGLRDLETELQHCKQSGSEHSCLSSDPQTVNPILYNHDNDVFFTWGDSLSYSAQVVSFDSYNSYRQKSVRDSELECTFFCVKRLLPTDAISIVSVGDHVIIGGRYLYVVSDVVETNGNDVTYFSAKGMQVLNPAAYSEPMSLQKKIPGLNFNDKTAALCFNFGRVLEEIGSSVAAKEIYTEIIKIHPTFLECKSLHICSEAYQY